uniref:putative SWI/SNF-related matrix-associated actin-dependent regulator of chromatin subfamily A member 3-like 3 n=1 Tax=Fragaria vesca subsp. vesca TaxID=101020 RepID=UPI0005C942AF|nr:PREDICTED: putative SWI/SNF-related matrix-associated actin-dependent regulator of chromatin subfamily A member 3-like 3 [Fragaria vesca subsp. vesca]
MGSLILSRVGTWWEAKWSLRFRLLDDEIVHLAFPTAKCNYKSRWIVRFSTKRSGEIGRFPMEWAKSVVPLVDSGKVKVLGRFMGAPKCLSMTQDIVLSVSFFIHRSVFTDGDKKRLHASSFNKYAVPPILGVLNLLKIEPFEKAEFTAEELDCALNPQVCIDKIFVHLY